MTVSAVALYLLALSGYFYGGGQSKHIGAGVRLDRTADYEQVRIGPEVETSSYRRLGNRTLAGIRFGGDLFPEEGSIQIATEARITRLRTEWVEKGPYAYAGFEWLHRISPNDRLGNQALGGWSQDLSDPHPTVGIGRGWQTGRFFDVKVEAGIARRWGNFRYQMSVHLCYWR